MKKASLILFCILGLGFVAYRIYDYRSALAEEELETATAAAAPQQKDNIPPKPPLRAVDIDALAARMKNYQDVYTTLRDKTLAVYNKRNPVKGSHYDAAEKAIKLAAYLWTWGDYYQEGLWQAYAAYADEACLDTDPNDPLMQLLYDIYQFGTNIGTHDDSNLSLMKECEDFGKSEYPTEFKFMVYGFMMRNFSDGKESEKYQASLPQSIALLPEIVAQLGEYYKILAIQKTPDAILFRQSSLRFDQLRDDGETLLALGNAFDKALEAADPDGALRPAVQADFQISYAWNARGSGWASSVTEEGWKLMNERIAKANDILELAYLKHPDTAYIPCLMMTVELAQGEDRKRMEEWFQRALAADPNSLRAYERKMYYLTPRWHGSTQEMATFGKECIETGNWESGIPMVALNTISDLAENEPEIYANPDVWKLVEGLYETYLEKYPESVMRRGQYMKVAAAGGHWATAQKQLTLLGPNWDRHSFEKGEFESLQAKIEKESVPKPTAEPTTPQ